MPFRSPRRHRYLFPGFGAQAGCIQSPEKRLEHIFVVIAPAELSAGGAELYGLSGLLDAKGHGISQCRDWSALLSYLPNY
jgi:hypothetical protein